MAFPVNGCFGVPTLFNRLFESTNFLDHPFSRWWGREEKILTFTLKGVLLCHRNTKCVAEVLATLVIKPGMRSRSVASADGVMVSGTGLSPELLWVRVPVGKPIFCISFNSKLPLTCLAYL